MNFRLFALMVVAASCQMIQAQNADQDVTTTNPAEAAKLQATYLADIRQLTFEGRRAGEGYFSKDGRQLVFQSEREPGNPFFQIYLMDRESGDTHRVSPGFGKTTCAWIHPDGTKVLYASTQYDVDAEKKQVEELEKRKTGKQSRYSWDYDATYDLIEFDVKTKSYRKLTDMQGYDAEGSYSPDGQWVCFASNRRAYSNELTAEEKQLFEQDPASATDIYIMKVDGTELKRLTDTVGYDGGPFFSPDGNQICWRRFSRDGATAEIMLMSRDGSHQRAITSLGAMSWAPYFHPSGDYLIFATNRHGFSNFELYMIDAKAQHEPVRVTYRAGFDGLPVFTPDGNRLVWTSNGGSTNSQLWEAAWNDAEARKALGIGKAGDEDSIAEATAAKEVTAPGFAAADVGRHVDYLCRPELGGRLTGTEGEKKATAYVAAYLEGLGLQPAGKDGSFFHEFQFTSDVKLGPKNQLQFGNKQYEVGKDWRPVFFSQMGEIEPTEVVFAGYGIVAPGEEGQPEYDSYVHLDVESKWVLVYRNMPQDVSAERRQHLARFSGLRYKAMVARERGARGLIVVSGPTSQARQQLVPLTMDGSLGSSSLAVISVTDKVADEWFKAAGQDLAKEQRNLDRGDLQLGWMLPDVKIAAHIDIEPITSRGRNVVAWLPAADKPTAEAIVIGAHIDHLGKGQGGGSLARDEEVGGTHRGADDNASGVASVLEIAQYLANEKAAGKLTMKRDILIAAWSGEELGLRGSQAFAEDFPMLYPERMLVVAKGDTKVDEASQGAAAKAMTLYPALAGCLNLDMVGRLREQLVLQGIASSPYWNGVIERRNSVVKLPLSLQNDCHLPTDASTFFLKGVPILSAFTGSHSEYHTPRDTPELLNYEGAAQVARLMALVARDLVQTDNAPEFRDQPAEPQMRANLTAYLGTVPDYAKTDVKGVALGGVTKGAPAEKSGMKAGDVIVELAGKKIENIYDYTFAIEALKVGQAIKAKVKRGEETLELEVIPASRQ